jgi:hypothetical protein
MGKNLKLPRAKDPARAYAWLGSAWNGIADLIERYTNIDFVGANVTITSSGMRVAYPRGATGGGAQIPGQFTSIISGSGEYYNGTYSGGYGSGTNAFTSAGNLTDLQLGITNTSSACTIVNVGSPDDWSHHMLPIPSGDADNPILMLTPTGMTDPHKSNRPIFLVNYTSDLYYVALTQTGGSNGTQTTAASWTYTMKNENGETLGTGVSPATTRPNGTQVAATYGSARWNGSTWILVSLNEVYGTGTC